jgi:hypothetical protein
MSEKSQEDWMNKKWRPAMGWTYMGICILDMAVFPILWSVTQVLVKQPVTQWDPLTLKGAGLFHLAMGAVLGIAAWSRGQEKMAGVATPQTPNPLPTSSLTSTISAVQPTAVKKAAPPPADQPLL